MVQSSSNWVISVPKSEFDGLSEYQIPSGSLNGTKTYRLASWLFRTPSTIVSTTDR